MTSTSRFRAAFYRAGLPAGLEPAFALSPAEWRFARSLCSRHSQLWLFRTNQKLFCGDFVIVDMSARAPAGRRCVVAELKAASRLRNAGGWQCKNAHRAAAEIANHTGAISRGVQPVVYTGEHADLLRAVKRS